jgi:hypothetical protein
VQPEVRGVTVAFEPIVDRSDHRRTRKGALAGRIGAYRTTFSP